MNEKISKEQTQNNVLVYSTYLRFHNYKPAIEVDDGHIGRNIDYEIKRKIAVGQKLGCKFIRIDPEKENFNTFKAINEIPRYIKQSSNH